MRLGFAITSHKDCPELAMLVRQLRRCPNSTIAIHHDFTKSPLSSEILEDPNVHVITPSYRTEWAHISVYRVMMDMLFYLVNAKPKVDWIINLSANDFPVKSWSYIREFLRMTEYRGFVQHYRIKRGDRNQSWLNNLYRAVYFRRILKMPSLDRRLRFKWRGVYLPRSLCGQKVPEIPLYHGENWWIVSKQVAEFMLNWEHRYELERFMEDVNETELVCAPEIIPSTAAYHCPLKIGYEDMRFIDWSGSNGLHPNVLDESCWEKIQSPDELFARKFVLPQSEGLYRRLLDGPLSEDS